MTHPDGELVLRVMTMPRDTNHSGTVFGGVIMSYIDQAAYVHARTLGLHRWVTVMVERIEFVAPVYVGELVTLRATTLMTGRSSVTIRILVDAERYSTGKHVRVTESIIKMVALGADHKPIAFTSPATLSSDDVERRT
ncbi:MAG: acyl-CoA thioesterase [Phycisphaerales bacterium]|nr:acyl-CoA thioesterase [Phycisphaerales bacterium]